MYQPTFSFESKTKDCPDVLLKLRERIALAKNYGEVIDALYYELGDDFLNIQRLQLRIQFDAAIFDEKIVPKIPDELKFYGPKVDLEKKQIIFPLAPEFNRQRYRYRHDQILLCKANEYLWHITKVLFPYVMAALFEYLGCDESVISCITLSFFYYGVCCEIDKIIDTEINKESNSKNKKMGKIGVQELENQYGTNEVLNDSLIYEYFIRRCWGCERFQHGANTDVWSSLKGKGTDFEKEFKKVKGYVDKAFDKLLPKLTQKSATQEEIDDTKRKRQEAINATTTSELLNSFKDTFNLMNKYGINLK